MTPQLGEHCKLNVYISLSFVHFGLKQNSILNHFRDNLYSAFCFFCMPERNYTGTEKPIFPNEAIDQFSPSEFSVDLWTLGGLLLLGITQASQW